MSSYILYDHPHPYPGTNYELRLVSTEVETSVISVPALSSPVPEAKYLANPSILEPALKVEAVSTVSVLAASQVTGVSIISAFGGLVWYDAGSDWGFSKDFRGRAGISIGRYSIG